MYIYIAFSSSQEDFGKNLHHLMMLLELGRGGGGRVWVSVVMKLNPGVYDTKASSLNLKCFLLVFVA